ncbi:hypothetical protein D3C72_1147220 [compost metagenome]
MAGVKFHAMRAGNNHRRAQHLGYVPAKRIFQEIIQVGRPADGHGTARQAVFEQQTGGHDEGKKLADGGVGKRIRGAGGGDAERQLRIAQGRQAGRDGGDQERQDDRWARLGHGFDHGKENARADGGADADHGEGKQADGPAQATAAEAFTIFDRGIDRLGAANFLDQGLAH